MQSVVWIANRQNPIIGEGGAFAFGENGELMVLDGNGQSVWSSHTSVTSGNATAILMDTGNFIIWNGDQNVDVNVALWQSFNHPTDTFLPEMKVKIPAAETPVFTAWRSADDPSPGQYSMGIDPRGPPQIVIWDGSRRRWRSGQFDGIIFTGVPNMPAIFSSGFRLLSEEDGDMYFIYHSSNISALLRFRIGWDGNEELQKWDEGRGVWNITQWQPANGCELYNKCGAFAICSVKDSRLCTCIEGFVPKNEDQWKGRNWTEGCVRRTELECQWNSSGIGADDGGGDGFRRIQGVKLPDFADFMTAANFDECRDKCLKNCSCLAYAFDRGINCLIWGGDLVDIQLFAQGGNDLYIRLAGSELGQENKISKLVIVVIVVIGAFCIVVSIWLLWRFRMKKKEIPNSQWKNNQLPAIDARSGEYLKDFSVAEELGVEGKQRTGPELFLFSFSDVAAATNNFSDIKKLGKGGFGPVFKGMLPGGEEIAVKRLSRMSGQGLEEFKNEIMLIAKLQHINLVRLLGCCIEGDERMLIYEYMPNNSLDSFLFDPFKRAQLDWEKRISIIEGIARGLLYLHRDSRLRIIHRDLKASNVLLDEDLNPKISDFGLAKIFRRNESEASTSRVVGT
ncbi:Non-specific serine/threonine protein kinase [Bertholletia excelsa]